MFLKMYEMSGSTLSHAATGERVDNEVPPMIGHDATPGRGTVIMSICSGVVQPVGGGQHRPDWILD